MATSRGWSKRFCARNGAGEASGWGLQAGLTSTPFSLEHIGPAWTPEYALSASALDNWLWEEISLAGIEGEWWHAGERGPRLGLVVGAGFGPDQLGRLLALRGWVIGDGLSGLNSDLPLPNGTRTDIFDERDDRPAAYTLVTLSDPGERAALQGRLLRQSRRPERRRRPGTRTSRRSARSCIRCRISTSSSSICAAKRGCATRPTTVRCAPSTRCSRIAIERIVSTVRYDEFRLDDLDGGNSTAERGDGITAAYAFEWGLRQRIGRRVHLARQQAPAQLRRPNARTTAGS